MGGSKEIKVSIHFGLAANPCPASTMSAPHQVADLTFDLGAGGSVVGCPVGILLLLACFGEVLFMRSNSDAAAT